MTLLTLSFGTFLVIWSPWIPSFHLVPILPWLNKSFCSYFGGGWVLCSPGWSYPRIALDSWTSHPHFSSVRITSECYLLGIECVNLALKICHLPSILPPDFLTSDFLSYTTSSLRPEVRPSSTYHLFQPKGLPSSPTRPHTWHHYPKWFCFNSGSFIIYFHHTCPQGGNRRKTFIVILLHAQDLKHTKLMENTPLSEFIKSHQYWTHYLKSVCLS